MSEIRTLDVTVGTTVIMALEIARNSEKEAGNSAESGNVRGFVMEWATRNSERMRDERTKVSFAGTRAGEFA